MPAPAGPGAPEVRREQSMDRFAKVFLAGMLVMAASSLLVHSRGSAAGEPDGKAIFTAKCSTCHQANGAGNGPYPPLAGNPDIVSSDTQRIISTVLNGRSGPIEILGKSYNGNMPVWRDKLTNAEVAAVVSYVRSAWGNKAALVTEDQVALVRSPTALSGGQIFAAKCSTCHGAAGQGSANVPPLAGNPHVAGEEPAEMVATIVNGRSGALTVNGKAYNGTMPTWKGQLSNADIAAVATFVRMSWGNKASGVTEAQVAGAGPSVSTKVGASIYAAKCAACHQANGQGNAMFPSLASNKNVTSADPSEMIATIEHGRSMMPSWKGQLSNADIAAVATYVRSAWGNKAEPVTEQQVSAVH
jgi:cbb3-type cytochrome c oxidase subunit III